MTNYTIFNEDEITWNKAREMCKKKGMRLAKFMTKEELYNATLLPCQSGSTKDGHYWIGLKRNSSTGLLSWSDDSKQFHFKDLSVCQNISKKNVEKCQKQDPKKLCYNVHIECKLPHLHEEECKKTDKAGYICENTGTYCNESRHV